MLKEMAKLMNHGSGFQDATTPTTGERFAVNSLHPAWRQCESATPEHAKLRGRPKENFFVFF